VYELNYGRQNRITGAEVHANSDSVVGLATRMGELDARLCNMKELAVVGEADGDKGGGGDG